MPTLSLGGTCPTCRHDPVLGNPRAGPSAVENVLHAAHGAAGPSVDGDVPSNAASDGEEGAVNTDTFSSRREQNFDGTDAVVINIQTLPPADVRDVDVAASGSSQSVRSNQGEPSAPSYPTASRTEHPSSASGVIGWAVNPARRTGPATRAVEDRDEIVNRMARAGIVTRAGDHAGASSAAQLEPSEPSTQQQSPHHDRVSAESLAAQLDLAGAESTAEAQRSRTGAQTGGATGRVRIVSL